MAVQIGRLGTGGGATEIALASVALEHVAILRQLNVIADEENMESAALLHKAKRILRHRTD
ncbi:hypothetical protein EJB05_55048, partial [Eragrostis curvula]